MNVRSERECRRVVPEPELHLLDCCVETDNGTCIIVTRAEHARDLRHTPALIRGWLEIGSATLLLATAVLGIALVWAARPAPEGREPGAR